MQLDLKIQLDITMNKLHFNILIITLGLVLSGCDTKKTTQEKTAFILVNDDSGVLTQPQRASKLKLLMLAQLKDLRKKLKFSKAKLQIISTSYGRSVWVGSIADLKSKRAADVVAKIESKATHCNRLSESFDSIRTSIRQLEQQGYSDVHIYFFSSMISTPPVCNDDVDITLPQLPVPADFTGTLTSSDIVKTIAMYYVNPHQLRAYQEALIPVASWANVNNKDFGIYDMEDTEFQLRHGLLGVK